MGLTFSFGSFLHNIFQNSSLINKYSFLLLINSINSEDVLLLKCSIFILGSDISFDSIKF